MAGEEEVRRADIGAGRMGTSSWVRRVTGIGYPDEWGCETGGLGYTEMGGN